MIVIRTEWRKDLISDDLLACGEIQFFEIGRYNMLELIATT